MLSAAWEGYTLHLFSDLGLLCGSTAGVRSRLDELNPSLGAEAHLGLGTERLA